MTDSGAKIGGRSTLVGRAPYYVWRVRPTRARKWQTDFLDARAKSCVQRRNSITRQQLTTVLPLPLDARWMQSWTHFSLDADLFSRLACVQLLPGYAQSAGQVFAKLQFERKLRRWTQASFRYPKDKKKGGRR